MSTPAHRRRPKPTPLPEHERQHWLQTLRESSQTVAEARIAQARALEERRQATAVLIEGGESRATISEAAGVSFNALKYSKGDYTRTPPRKRRKRAPVAA